MSHLTPLEINHEQMIVIAADGGYELRCAFSLDPITDMCVRYVLHIASAPENTQIYINDWLAGIFQKQSFAADVTDHVWLENNVLVLRIFRRYSFGPIYLQPVPCPVQA
jgi:hypothetical protein